VPDAQVLIVDDDPALRRVVEVGLTARGYAVATAATGSDALDSAERLDPDVVILDLGLPDMDGIDVADHLRRRRAAASIVVLSADGAEDRKVRALEDGADDYLTKPFSMSELLARVGVAMRHRRALAPLVETELLTIGALQIDIAGHEARIGGDPLDLTPKEFALLTLLARNAGKVLTHRAILDQVWSLDQALDTLRTHVSQLRRKLGDGVDTPRLVTEPAIGYRMLAPADR
jgi:two-component system, OmpR family, KDP operon response regulator KdpE